MKKRNLIKPSYPIITLILREVTKLKMHLFWNLILMKFIKLSNKQKLNKITKIIKEP